MSSRLKENSRSIRWSTGKPEALGTDEGYLMEAVHSTPFDALSLSLLNNRTHCDY